jgi:glycerol-3-phosphate acyltransferase PlsY
MALFVSPERFRYTDSVTPVRRALPRAAFHATAGIIMVLALYFLPRLIVQAALAFGTVVFLVMDLTRLRFPGIGRIFASLFTIYIRRAEDTRILGASYFLVGCLVSVLAFPRDIAVLAILFLSLGDPAATIIGTWKGHVRLRGKSIEGNAACLVVCLAISYLVTSITHHTGYLVGAAGAFFAALFESLPLPVNDNLTIPIGSGFSMMVLNLLTG